MKSRALVAAAVTLLLVGSASSRHVEDFHEEASGGFSRSLMAACAPDLKNCQISPGKFACKLCCKDADCPSTGATANTRCDKTGRAATWSCVCKAGFDKCDCNSNNGCETSLTTRDNCGRCGNKCGPNQDCINGDCTCKANFGECNGKLNDGCEASLLTDMKNCGKCGNACGAGEECKNGQCFCKGTTITDPDSVTACGFCGNVCGKNMDCSDGACVCKQAAPNAAGVVELWGNCDGVQSTGCEVNLMASDTSCGKCGVKCAAAAHEHCLDGQCKCDAGWGDCTAASPGCETNLLTSNANCGACGKACGNNTACVNGQCMACKAGWGNCDGNWDNGCEVNFLGNNAAHCGACFNTCETYQKCVAGKKQCKTSLNEDTSCGVCGYSCALGEQCVTDAEDTPYCACAPDKKDCDGLRGNGCETDISDPENCGECNNVCGDGTECRLDELTGLYACFCSVPPEELNTNDNCGQCGNVCNGDGNEECVDSKAGTGKGPAYQCQCTAGFGDCDIDMPGCETELSTDYNCGSCGNVCSAGLHCANTASPADPPVYECVCDDQDFSKLTNCGGCGLSCAANQVCANVGGEGVDAVYECLCKANFQNCNAADEDPTNPDGCETDLTQPDNCGGCGVICEAAEECQSGPAGGPSYCACKSDNFTTNDNCGFCGNACNANEQCTLDLATGDYSCQCAEGFDSCDGQAGTGCLTPLNTISNCGACNQTCVAGKEACNNGACTCIDQDFSKPTNCGTCGNTCGTNQECVAVADPAPGEPAYQCDCMADYTDCDGNTATGCEAHLLSNSSCGACDITCSAAETCTASGCECLDQDFTKPTNCGTCSNTCGDNETCTSVDPVGTDPANQCLCNAGFADCDGNCDNGIETDITDPNYNCSACNDTCNVGQVCDSGFCVDQA
ncbi:hypothetical protein ABPG75_003420 [Micractinium tetrahymenae]